MADGVTRPGRLLRIGVVLPPDPGAAVALAVLCDRVGIEAVWAADEALAGLVRENVQRAAVLVMSDSAEPGQRTVALSIGRTLVEALARAEMDRRVTGFPVEAQLFGSLEDCQAAVDALAADGVTDLRCVIPDTQDVHDLIAQLTAITVRRPAAGGAPRIARPLPPPFMHDGPGVGAPPD
jgi:hypothetical protein